MILAAAQTERLCCSMELDPKYVDVIVKRYIQNTGSNASVFLFLIIRTQLIKMFASAYAMYTWLLAKLLYN